MRHDQAWSFVSAFVLSTRACGERRHHRNGRKSKQGTRGHETEASECWLEPPKRQSFSFTARSSATAFPPSARQSSTNSVGTGDVKSANSPKDSASRTRAA